MSIVKGKFSKRKFIKERAKELNYDLPKSEVWFFEKFKHSFLYRTMKWEANLPVFDCYIVDWFCGRYRFVIEVDGTFHNKKETIEKDKIRDKRLKAGGLTVFRVKAYDEQGYREFIHRLYKEYKKKKLKKKSDHSKPINCNMESTGERYYSDRKHPVNYKKRQKEQTKFSTLIRSVDFKVKMPF